MFPAVLAVVGGVLAVAGGAIIGWDARRRVCSPLCGDPDAFADAIRPAEAAAWDRGATVGYAVARGQVPDGRTADLVRDALARLGELEEAEQPEPVEQVRAA